MADQYREEPGTVISRRTLLVRGGLFGLLAFVAPSLMATDEAEAGHRGKRRRIVKVKHRGFKRHAKFRRHRGFKARVSVKRHAGFRKHRGFKAHRSFKKHRGFKRVRMVRFKKRW